MNSIKVDQALSQQLFQILSKASLETLNVGDILQGRVQSLENGLLLIKLLDGISFTAKVSEGFSASHGDLITLEIGERLNNDQLTATIVDSTVQRQANENTDQPPLTDVIGKNLAAHGIKPSEKLIAGVLDILKAEPDLPLNQATFLVANKMDSNPELLKIIQRISEHEFQLHDNLQSLKDGLVKGLTFMDSALRQKALMPLMVSQELDSLSQHLNQVLSDIPADLKESILQNVRELLTKTLLDEMPKGQEKLYPSQVFDQKSIEDVLKNILEPLKSVMNPLKSDELNAEIEAKLSLFKPQDGDDLLKVINKALKDIHIKTEGQSKGDTKEVEALLEKLFDKAVINGEHGSLEDMNIKEKTKALKDIMDFSQKVLRQMDTKTQETTFSVFKEIDQAFRFFNQVTTYDSIIQIPLKINREDTTGELYVMKRKKGRKKFDAENFTLLLSLQTSNLGRVESFLNTSHKCVTISLRVEQEQLVKLVKDQHRSLYDGLLKKGYTLAEMKCRVLENDEAGILDAARKTQDLLGLQSSVDLRI